MAKKTYQIAVESPARSKALDALLVALGFEKTGPNQYDEKSTSAIPARSRVATPVRKPPARATKPVPKPPEKKKK